MCRKGNIKTIDDSISVVPGLNLGSDNFNLKSFFYDRLQLLKLFWLLSSTNRTPGTVRTKSITVVTGKAHRRGGLSNLRIKKLANIRRPKEISHPIQSESQRSSGSINSSDPAALGLNLGPLKFSEVLLSP